MSWKNFNINPWLIAELKNNQINMPTEIQKQVIPLVLKGNNLIVSSPTGTGKTHSFLIPILNNIETNNKIQAIIIVPTRELAQQIFKFTKQLTKNKKIRTACFVGGNELKKQIETFHHTQPEIIIGTAAKIKDLYQEYGLNITTAKMLVLDECDMLFDLGFIKDLDFLISKMNQKIQCLAFSATINQELEIFLKKYFKNTKIININNKTISPKIEHIFIECPSNKKEEQLLELINLINPYLCLIFVNNKAQINEIGRLLINHGKNSALLHSDLPSRNRKQIFKRIQNLDYQYIVTTDVSARGIDIPGISHVISLQVPYEINYYLHRAGRTGRNNQTGISYLFFDSHDLNAINEIKNYNIEIKYYKIKKNQLIPENKIINKKSNTSKNKTITKVVNQFNAQKKVKPGYKKKFKTTIKKLTKKEKQQLQKNRRK